MKPRFAVMLAFMLAFSGVCLSFCSFKQAGKKDQTINWILHELYPSSPDILKISGNPQIVKSPYGKAVSFDGERDGIFLDQMPLAGLSAFTVEVLVFFAEGGNFEQRFLHIGEVNGPRMLLEIRATETDWYFDAFFKSEEDQLTLINPDLLHPLGQWYHVAFVVDHGRLVSYVNGVKELEGRIEQVPLAKGKTSIGVRQNEVAWFKGAIRQIRITEKALEPEAFLNF